MDRMQFVGLYQTDVLMKEADEYDGPDINYEGLGIPDKREIVKEGEYVGVACTIDLSGIDYTMAWKFGDIDVVKIVLKSGNSVYIKDDLSNFDAVWMRYKAIANGYEFMIKDIEKEDTEETA